MKLSVEEVQTVQKQQQEGVSAVQGMLECKGTGRGQSHTASSFVWLTWEWAGSAWELGSFSVAAFTSGLKSCTHPTGNPKQYQQYHLTLGEQKRNYCKGS